MARIVDLTNPSNNAVAAIPGTGVFQGTRNNPIVLDVLERAQDPPREDALPSGDTIHVVSEPVSTRTPRPGLAESARPISDTSTTVRQDSTANSANASQSLKRKISPLSSIGWQTPPTAKDEMSKPHPLEPRVSGANFSYPPRPRNNIVLTPKEHHSGNAQREYPPSLPYMGDGSRPTFAPQTHRPYPAQYFSPPGPPIVPHSGLPLEPPRYRETKYIHQYVQQPSPPAQFVERPLVRPMQASPSSRMSEPSPWPSSSSTPSSIKPEPSPQLPEPSAPIPSAIDFTEAAFNKVVDKYQHIVRDQHDYNVKTLLMRARATTGRRQQSDPGRSAANPTSGSGLGVFVHSKSPFAELKSIEFDRSKIDGRKKPTQKLAQWYAKASKAGSAKPYAVNAYTDGTPKVPGYAHYTSLKHNMLVEDDNHRTFYTSFGDDADDDDSDSEPRSRHADGGIRDQEDVIAKNQQIWHKLNAMTERARAYAPYVDDLLSELGCDVESLLGYLVDDLITVPDDVPKELAPLWESRDKYLDHEGFYEDEKSHDAKRIQRRWKLILDRLPKTATEPSRRRAAAGLAFVMFSKRAGFSLWHIVRVSHLSQDNGFAATDVAASVERPSYDLQTYTDLACLACKAHECPGHGEWEDVRTRFTLEQSMGVLARNQNSSEPTQPIAKRSHDASSTLLGLNDDGTVTGLELDYVTSNESSLDDTQCCSETCFWRKRNRTNSRGEEKSSWSREESHIFDSLYPAYYTDRRGACMLARSGVLSKTCAAIFERMVLKGPAVDLPYSISRRQTGETRAVLRRPPGYWQDHFKATSSLHLRTPYVPCNHAGPCSQETGCDCFNAGTTCEKFCNCSDDCQRRFPGCSCHAKGTKKLCQTNNCECYQLNRECDPDLCHGCRAHEILDPVNRHDQGILEGKCHNVLVQRAVPKRTLIGVSKLLYDGGKYGFGLYMGETCNRGDFIGEYVGEIVSDSEAGRRGAVYDKIEMSYLFDLNIEQTLDSMVFGNKTRFINDQDEKQANCVARVMLCGMVTRIGMFAKREIAVGEELFFDYGHGFRKRFDLIKRNDKGVAVVEKRNKLKSNPKKGKAKLKSPSYSKNGRRIGRPPKNLASTPVPLPPPEPDEESKPIPFRGTSRKRRRSDSSSSNSEKSSISERRNINVRDSEDESADEEVDDDDADDDTSDYDPHSNASQREGASHPRTRAVHKDFVLRRAL